VPQPKVLFGGSCGIGPRFGAQYQVLGRLQDCAVLRAALGLIPPLGLLADVQALSG
jgi:hypothetical protein